MNFPAQPILFAVEIGGTKLQLALGRGDGTLEQLERFDIRKEEGAAGILARLDELLPRVLKDRKPRAAGVGFGGPIDGRTGRISRSHQVEGWSDFHLREWFESRLGCPVLVENDANMAAIGEAVCGAGPGFDPIFYVTLGSGVGGGLVVGGSLYHGAVPGEAEFGQLLLDHQGTRVEAKCSGWAVDARIRTLARQGSTGPLAEMARRDPGQESRHLRLALEADDPDARTILDEVAGDLAMALSHVSHLVHPGLIVLGGGLALLGEPLRARVEKALGPLLMEAFRPGPVVAVSRLGHSVVPVGGLVMAGRLDAATRRD